MTTLILAATNPAVDIAERFGFNKQLFTTHLIGFAVLAFLLHRFAYKPLLEMLDQRRARIAESMANADRMKAELANAQIKAQELLSQAGAQANKVIEEARAAAARITETETQKAVAAAGEIIAKAKQANEAELTRMKAELRKEVGRLVVATSVKVTGKILTLDDQQRLAEDTQRQLAA